MRFKILVQIKEIFFPKTALREYIKRKYLLDNLPEEQIFDKLRAAGWKDDVARNEFNKIKMDIGREEEKRKQETWEKGGAILLKKEEAEVKSIKRGDILNLALRIFKVKPGRTILTILGIGVSFGTIFFLVSLGYGLEQILLRQISSKEALLTLDVFSPSQELVPLDSGALKKISAIPSVKKTDPVVIVPGQADSGDFASEAVFYGVSDNFFKLSGLDLKEGEFFQRGENSIVVSSIFSQAFNVNGSGDLMGKEINLVFYLPQDVNGTEEIEIIPSERAFKIVGVVDNETDNFIYLPLDKIPDENIPYGLIKVVVKNDKNMEEVRTNIMDMGFNTLAIADTIEQADKIFKVFQVILALFGAAALIVAVIGMINTMTIALLERIQEVGIMKIVGVSEKDIKKIFLLEASIMGFLGGISGLLIGFLGSQIFNIGVSFLARSLGGVSVNLFFYPIWFITAIIIFASVVGFATGLMPSRRAANLDPLQALRYK